MKKILYSSLFLFSLLFNAQKNTLLNADFWKAKPTIETVKTEIAKGNNPSEFNSSTFDPVSLAINNGAPLSTIQFLIDQSGNSIDKLTHDGRIYLHWATMSGNPEVIQYLISKGSDVHKLDTKGLTPLTFGALFGLNNTEIYELFFKAGVQPKTKYKDGANILLLSIGNDSDGKLQTYFATKGLSIKDTDAKGNTAFDYAANVGNIQLLKSLREKGIKANDIALINAAQGTRRVTNGIELYKYLLEEVKLKPSALTQDGATPIQIIARKPNQSEIITYLLSKGIDPNKNDNDGNNALIVAAGAKDIANVKTLFPKIKNINAQNANGESALTNAIKSGTPEIASFLIANNANVKVLDTKGNNLAYYLIQSYRPGPGDEFSKKLQILQSNGLNLKQAQKDGSTLLHLAVGKENLDLFQKLNSLGIDINAKDQEEMTVLHKAALIAKDDSILKYIVSLGAKKDAKTELDETAYDLALENETLKNNKTSLDFLK